MRFGGGDDGEVFHVVADVCPDDDLIFDVRNDGDKSINEQLAAGLEDAARYLEEVAKWYIHRARSATKPDTNCYQCSSS
jgi:hypothetical protein